MMNCLMFWTMPCSVLAASTTSGACEESADNLVGGGTAGGSQDARGDAGHGVFLLLALPLGGLRLALSLALRRPRLALRFPFSGPCLARRAHTLP